MIQRDVSNYSVCPAMPRTYILVRIESAAWIHGLERNVPVIDRLVAQLDQLGPGAGLNS